MILQYFIKKENKQIETSQKIYLSIIRFINNHYKKNQFNIKKEFNSSFELTTLLVFVILFSNKNNNHNKIKQQIIDIFVKDLDISLRNLGIADIKIGKHVKKYVKKIYYRFNKLTTIFNEYDFEKFDQYVENINILHKESHHKKFSKYLFKYICNSINSTKSKKFSGFVYY